MNWKISPADRKVIRAYAAKAARMRPRQIEIEVGERYSLSKGWGHNSLNIKLVDQTEGREDSDLNQTWAFSDVKEIELTPEGEAEVDFYVYEMEGFGASRERGDLNTNVQAHVKLIDGKPRLWKMTDTDFKEQILI